MKAELIEQKDRIQGAGVSASRSGCVSVSRACNIMVFSFFDEHGFCFVLFRLLVVFYNKNKILRELLMSTR